MESFTNLQEINQEQALDVTKFFIRSKQNIFLFGMRGVGKTHIAFQAAESFNLKINYINLSVIDRCDLGGYPDINSPGNIINFKSPYYLPSIDNDQSPDSILLLDEVDKAPPEITSPLLEILQFKKVNGKKVNVSSCILTGNLIEEKANSNFLSTALLDRGAKYKISFNFDKWVSWAKENNLHDLILGFLKSNQDLALSTLGDYSYASPSPRSWALASDALYKAKDFKIHDSETICQIVSGFVGNTAGLKFKVWYDHYRKFEPAINCLVDSGIMSLNFNELSVSEQLVFVIATCYHVKQKVNSSLRRKNFCLFLENLIGFFVKTKVPLEMQFIGLNNSFDFDYIAKNKLYTCKIFFDHFSRLNEGISIKK